jgi:Antibiotic biosynthesis monooxygenase
MTTPVPEIIVGATYATFINVFTCEPGDQDEVVRIDTEIIDNVASRAPGFISASVHRSIDGTKDAAALGPFVDRYGEDAPDQPDRLHSVLFGGTRSGGLSLLRDLHDLYLMACQCEITWTLVGQAAQGARDRDLLAVVAGCEGETAAQVAWLRSRMKEAAQQVLVVSP